ncbi:MAG: class I SAM-dependent methyltransferase [Sedimentisphaerales bacterium]|nr:class I SAM-dependent methyltransferase [Sedimentisphaerales bacterium]
MTQPHVVKGYGILDRFLAVQRHKIAARKLTPIDKKDRILDLGCGSYPLFLLNSDFSEKYGLDQEVRPSLIEDMKQKNITLINHNFEIENQLPFKDDFFDAITMLAVFEHLEPARLMDSLREIKRILRPHGRLVLTTPAFWTEKLLKLLAWLRLISGEALSEHKDAYTHKAIVEFLVKAGFAREKIQVGYFELFMNSWALADK